MALINGTAGDDFIIGTLEADRVFAGAGDDIILGGAGDDILFGQEGEDTYVFTTGFGADLVGDGLNSANDVIHLVDLTAADIRLTTNSADQLVVHVRGAADTIAISEHLNGVSIETILFGDGTTLDLTGGLTLTGAGADDRMWGTAFDDRIFGKAGADTLFGQLGDDFINSGAGADTVYGDTNILTGAAGGADIIKTGAGDDRVLAGGGDDRVFGGADDDDLFGLAGSDLLKGGAGSDILTGGEGDDRLVGGADDDIFQFDDDGSRDVVRDFTGDDILSFVFAGVTLGDLTFSQINGGNDLLIDAGVAEVVLKGLTLADIDLIDDFLF